MLIQTQSYDHVATLWSCQGNCGRQSTYLRSEQRGVEGPEQNLRGLEGSPQQVSPHDRTGTPKVSKQEKCWQWSVHKLFRKKVIWEVALSK